MAVVRDPAFWKRFSMAVHMDEEKAQVSDSTSTSSSSTRPPLKTTDSWLERNKRKSRRTRVVGCVIALMILLIIVGLLIILLWLQRMGPFAPASAKPTTETNPT